MLRFIFITQILFLSVTVYCQDTGQIIRIDSLGNNTEVMTLYDVENIKYSEVYFVNDSIKDAYFSRKGDTISVYDWGVDDTIIKRIQGQLVRKYYVTDETYIHGGGGPTFYLILDYKRNVFELRDIRRITEGIDKEMIRLAHEVEKDLIHILPPDLKTPIVIPFPFRLHEWQKYFEY